MWGLCGIFSGGENKYTEFNYDYVKCHGRGCRV